MSHKSFKATGIPAQDIIGAIRDSFIDHAGGETGALDKAIRAALTST